MSKEKFESEILSLGNNFFANRFNIPIYQRLYVWGIAQVNTLIEDLTRAYLHDKHHIYYLGGIVIVGNSEKFDLIDGQQRFTTLKILRELLGDKQLTLDFSIRENVWDDFTNLKKSDNADIQRMIDAKELLKEGLEKKYDGESINKEDFLKYIKEQVHLVVTTVPENTDLNKLFELINGRGEQLQQHEILKAKILSKITDKREEYGKIWDISADMDEHVDISIKKTLLKEDKKIIKNISWADYFSNYCQLDIAQLLDALKIDNKKSEESSSENSIYRIIDDSQHSSDSDENTKLNDPEDEASTKYLSIVSFPLFLLYTLIALEKENFFTSTKKVRIEFKEQNLIKIFEIVLGNEPDEEKAKAFLTHLFKLRKLFDKWVIKNEKEIGNTSNDTNHKITYIQKIDNSGTISRQIDVLKDSRDMSLLQSMLYHSHTRNTQEWLIPFLSNIQENSDTVSNMELLKNIDDYLYSQINSKKSILERAGDYTNSENAFNSASIINHLQVVPEDYHYFSHYWFYKMDWIIWDLSDKKDEQFKFTARNSIEHIGPQNPQDENQLSDKVDKLKHSFGNLFLVSISQNSSVGNSGFHTKKAMFLTDKKVKNLKLNLLSLTSVWGDEGVQLHLDECMKKVKTYYSKDKTHSKITESEMLCQSILC